MAEQRHPNMVLLLHAEQTVTRKNFVNPNPNFIRLPELRTPDGPGHGRLAFRAILSNPNNTSLIVVLITTNYVGTNPLMLHVKMIGGLHGTDTRTAEAHVLVDKDTQPMKKIVTSLPLQGQSFGKVTVVFTLYELGSRPESSAGLHLNHARLEGTLCDVKLVVDGVELVAHRTVLAARSPVLSNMLTGDFKEAHEGRVKLVDFSRAAVEKFLEYLYTDYIENWGNSELELLQLADKYLVPELRAECALRLWSCDPPRALEVLRAAAAAGPGLSEVISSSVRQRLTATVVDNMKTLKDTAQWAEFKAAHPFLVDVMLGSSSNNKPDENITSAVWTE